jgi:hypothetical protein
MGIKFGSVILTILFIFIAKISFDVTASNSEKTQVRSPASISAVNSIDEDYRIHIQGVKARN